MRIRNAARGLIVQDDSLLVLKYREGHDEWFLVPGGGQEPGEPLEQTVQRECKEEVNVDVEVKELLFIREYIGKNHEFAATHDGHQVDFFFLCTIRSGRPAVGKVADKNQVGVEWMKLTELETKEFYPKTMRRALVDALRSKVARNHLVYMGDIN